MNILIPISLELHRYHQDALPLMALVEIRMRSGDDRVSKVSFADHFSSARADVASFDMAWLGAWASYETLLFSSTSFTISFRLLNPFCVRFLLSLSYVLWFRHHVDAPSAPTLREVSFLRFELFLWNLPYTSSVPLAIFEHMPRAHRELRPRSRCCSRWRPP